MITKIKMEGKYWGVFLSAKGDSTDRYLLTSPLDKEIDADHFVTEFRRIIGTWRAE
jgi:hypothetical protein